MRRKGRESRRRRRGSVMKKKGDGDGERMKKRELEREGEKGCDTPLGVALDDPAKSQRLSSPLRNVKSPITVCIIYRPL